MESNIFIVMFIEGDNVRSAGCYEDVDKADDRIEEIEAQGISPDDIWIEEYVMGKDIDI